MVQDKVAKGKCNRKKLNYGSQRTRIITMYAHTAATINEKRGMYCKAPNFSWGYRFLCYNYKKQYSAEVVECLGNGKS